MRLLYLTFYFEPDLGPGSFRNTTLVNELAGQLTAGDSIHVITTQPNRYESYKPAAPAQEEWQQGGCLINVQRVAVPKHKSGLLSQVVAFWAYYRAARRLTKGQEYDLVIASSSRLFTAFLGARLAKTWGVPLFLDIRDLFREAIVEVIRFPLVKVLLDPWLGAVERYTFNQAAHINLVSAGFTPYFKPYRQATYSFFTNGIDDAFLDIPDSQPVNKPYKTILYAGNIGEGQGLHKLIPEAARQLGNGYRFLIIGDGGARSKLVAALRETNSTNVELRLPGKRSALIAEYQKADYLFLHLNDWEACRRVLPSKLFEYGATDKPILAGVAGYAATFMREQLPNCILFTQRMLTSLVRQLRETPYYTQARVDFKRRFQRATLNRQLARHIIQTLEATANRQPEVNAPIIELNP